MSTTPKMPRCFPRSDWEDGIYYPSSDGKPMAETGIHVLSLLRLYELLMEFFRDRRDVLITANQFWYWKKGDPKARRAPDVMIVPGVPREPPRRSYRMWLEGNTLPAAIFEMSSKKTIKNDLGPKSKQYELLGVHEYFLFDPDRRVLDPALRGFRLVNGQYEPIPPVDGLLESDLGFRLRIEAKILRLIDIRTNESVPFPEERVEQERQRADQERRRAEQEHQRADQERRRGDQFAAEIERLRRLLDERGGPAA